MVLSVVIGESWAYSELTVPVFGGPMCRMKVGFSLGMPLASNTTFGTGALLGEDSVLAVSEARRAPTLVLGSFLSSSLPY